MKKSRVWQAIVPGTQKQATRHPSNQENTLARRDETASCRPSTRAKTSLLNRMKKSRVWQAIFPGTQNKPQDTLQIRKTPWHGVTKQPPAVPLPGPNVTPEPNEKIKGLAGNCSRHTKISHKTPFKSGKHLVACFVCLEKLPARPLIFSFGSGVTFWPG